MSKEYGTSDERRGLLQFAASSTCRVWRVLYQSLPLEVEWLVQEGHLNHDTFKELPDALRAAGNECRRTRVFNSAGNKTHQQTM